MIREVIRIKKSEESGDQVAMLALILAKNDYNVYVDQGDEDEPQDYIDVVFWRAE